MIERWTTTEEDVRRRLDEDWGLSSAQAVEAIAAGAYTSENWRVRCGNDRFIAKSSHESEHLLQAGLNVAAQLDRRPFLTGRAIANRSGAFTRTLGPGDFLRPKPDHPVTVALLEAIPGRLLSLSEPRAPEIFGEVLARFHGEAQLLDPQLVRPRTLDWLADDRNHAFPGRPRWIAEVVRQSVDSAMSVLDCTYTPLMVTYCDVLEVMVDAVDRPVGLIDWGAASRAPLASDVACMLKAFRDQSPRADADAAAFVRSYRAHATFDLTGALDPELLTAFLDLRYASSAKWFAERVSLRRTVGASAQGEDARGMARSARWFAYRKQTNQQRG